MVVVAVYFHRTGTNRPAVAIDFGSGSDSGSCSIHRTMKVSAEAAKYW